MSSEEKNDGKPESTDPGTPSAKAAQKSRAEKPEAEAKAEEPEAEAKAEEPEAEKPQAEKPKAEKPKAEKPKAEKPKAEAKPGAGDKKPAAKATAGDKKPAAKAAAGDKKPAAEAKKPKEPEPEVAPEDMAEANRVFNRLFDVVERKQRRDPGLVNEAERTYDKLMKRVREQAKDMAAFEKNAVKSATILSNYAQLTGGHAKLTQLYFKLESLKALIKDAQALR